MSRQRIDDGGVRNVKITVNVQKAMDDRLRALVKISGKSMNQLFIDAVTPLLEENAVLIDKLVAAAAEYDRRVKAEIAEYKNDGGGQMDSNSPSSISPSDETAAADSVPIPTEPDYSSAPIMRAMKEKAEKCQTVRVTIGDGAGDGAKKNPAP